MLRKLQEEKSDVFRLHSRKKKVWSKLMNTEAGLSLGEWIYHVEETSKETIDGIHYLYEVKRHEKKRKHTAVPTTTNLMEVDPIGLVDENSAYGGGFFLAICFKLYFR